MNKKIVTERKRDVDKRKQGIEGNIILWVKVKSPLP